MKDTAKPMKSIRQAILSTLNTHGELTVDGMLDQITSFDRKTISSNVSQLVTEQLATRRKDDFTGAPAYRITDLGKARIKSEAAPVKDSLTTEPVKPVVKVNLTTEKPAVTIDQVIHEIFPVSTGELADLRKLVEDGAKENARLRSLNTELDKQADELLRVNSVLRESQSAGVARIDELSAALEQEHDEAIRLKEYCGELLDTNSDLATAAFNAAEQMQQVTVEQFMVRIPKHKPFVVKSLEKARQRAMSAAKSVGKAEVFAMVLVGHAMRGAVWEQS